MTDFWEASLTVGGHVTIDHLKDIHRICNELDVDDLDLDLLGAKQVMVYSCRSKDGKFQALEEYLQRQGIPFDRWSGPYQDFNPVIVRYRPESGQVTVAASSSGYRIIDQYRLEMAIERTGTREELVATLNKLIGNDVPNLPKISVVDSDGNPLSEDELIRLESELMISSTS